MLILESVHTYYGHIHALKGISLTVNEGEIVTLIGSNGAGKTTTLNTISGVLSARGGGGIYLQDSDRNGRGQSTGGDHGIRLDRLPAHEVARLGVSQSPEGRKIFARLSVQENLAMGAFARTDQDGISSDLERVLELFPRLQERLTQPGGTLSGGEQQMLAIGRALMSSPRILLLDEPSMGLAPLLVQQIFQIIREINAQGTTILLVEQNAQAALQVANRGYVLETGNIVLSGAARDLLADPQVAEAYLGI
ncbi:MAG: ABC transporter ATP-binding protein [Caldilineaceae bacterium SB0661_bin_32]|uniref:ABC transporter ATP-binding protein n=1 Tax=Caldilineaceae bacterium SB0661_bin_32 TaxID=2605255 RepID=A0A6B1D748_9CHLR|nr:ABC transporter ATP-binding protein [Caldilineaceae bacterium SB0661_bin_32]